MTKSKPKILKRLAKVVLATLLFTGEAQLAIGPSVVEAGQVTNVDDARVTADNAENSIVYGNNTGNIKEEKDDAVSLDGNTISINITKTLHRVYGGYSSVISAYTVSGNTVNIEKGMIQHDSGDVVVGGYSTNGGKITGNTVNVSGGSITGRVVGGCSMYGNVTGNAVNISGETTTINGDICGGDRAVGNQGSDVGSTTDNKVVISGGNVTGDVYGGTSSYHGGDITKNKVYIEGGTITGTVTGGKTLGQGNVTINEVHVTGGNVTKDVQGGLSSSNSDNKVDGNSVSISKDATVGGSVYGGKVDYNQKGNITNNTVTMSGGTVGGLYGGYSRQTHGTGTVSDNTVEMKGGKLSGYGYIVGGYSTENYTTEEPTKVDVKNNVVKITGDVDFKTSVVGGWAQGRGLVQNNRVEFSANNVDHYGEGEFSVGVTGGQSGSGGATDNKVIFSKGTVSYVTGGASNGASGDLKGNVLRNIVEMSGGTVYRRVTGGDSGFGKADNNEVTISKGSIGKSGEDSYIYGGKGVASASGNIVTIKGDVQLDSSTIIRGGYAHGEEYNSSTGQWEEVAGAAADNIVNIEKAITVKALYGGDGDAATSTGNTLNIAAKNVTVKDVGYFQNMNFFLPADIANNDTMLTVNGDKATDVKGVTFGAAALSGVKLAKGDTVNLITNSKGLTTDDNLSTTTELTVPKGLVKDEKYELSISKKDANTIIATVDNITEQKADEGGSGKNGGSGKKATSVSDILKSPVETRAGVVTLVNAGADLLVSQGMANAADAAAAERSGDNAEAAPRSGGFAPFAAVSLGKLRAQSGSHVDTKGIGLNLGFAREIENKSGKLLIGPVIEYGHGSYDSYQDSGIKADGKSSYWGIGVIAKQTNDNGFYYEGSLRAGRTKSDYNSDLRPGLHVSYDSSATYWAAHLGVGKLEDIGHDNTLDYYGKYFYSHTGSDSTYLNGANETANFDAVNSHRIRLGARLTHALNEKNKIYGGLAWQYEFNGDARATYSVSGEAPSPSVKGSSGMIELGWQVKPGKSPMTIDLGVTGWVGKQRGITANVQANWTF